MEMQQIRYFLAAAQELNFTRAAAKCRVSQPSLTRAIGLLEAELGGSLFRRERNLTHLTDLGRQMLPLLAKTIEHADQAARLAKAIGAGRVTSLCLGLPDGVALAPFAAHLVELTRAFPDLDLKLRRDDLPELTKGLRAGDIDLLIGPKPGADWDRYDHWPLFERPFKLVFRADHPLAPRDTLRPDDLQGSRLLHRPCCDTSTLLRTCLAQAGVSLRPAPEFARDDDLLAYLGASDCLALLPNGAPGVAGLTARALDGVPIGDTLHAITVCGRQRGAALNIFVTQLRAAKWHSVTA